MEVRDIAGIALILVVAGIVFAVNTEILYKQELKITPLTAINESRTLTNYTWALVSNVPLDSVSQLNNGTHIVNTSCYEWNPNGAVANNSENNRYRLINITGCDGGAGKYWSGAKRMNVTYTYREAKGQRVTRNASAGTVEIASWMGTIMVVVAGAIVTLMFWKYFLPGSGGGV